MLTLTSCTRVPEPGFSPSECLELARELASGDTRLSERYRDHKGKERWRAIEGSPRQLATTVAALRAFANA